VLGLGTPAQALGTLLDLGRFDAPQPVVGVVQDYRFHLPMSPVEPLVLYHDPSLFRWASIRIHPEAREAALAHLKAVWRRLDPLHPFEPRPFDEQLRDNDLTRAFRDSVQIVGLLAAIALAIAALGLLSMAAFRAQTRTKEVGIRKVLGAGVPGLVLLLSREFLWLIGIACVVGVPVAWFGNNAWLNSFAYRAGFGVEVFALGLGGVLLLVLLAVGSQAVRAALTNPVESLRYE
jgi:putative ABC transport system permease protein